MKNNWLRYFQKAVACTLVAFVGVPAGLYAQSGASPTYSEFSAPPSVMRESADAIFGRVFGTQGDGADIDYLVFEFSNRSPGNAAFRSALLPGWGQGFNGQKTKGLLLFSTFALATTGAIIRYNQAQDSYDEYKDIGLKDGNKYDEYESRQTQAMLLGTTAIILWGFSIFDAYKNAYTPLYSKERSLQFAFLPDHHNHYRGEVTWRKRF